MMVLLITLKPRLQYFCDGSVDHAEASSTALFDGSVDHTEASFMVVMVLLMTLKPRLWL
jgi:hypothetical protein